MHSYDAVGRMTARSRRVDVAIRLVKTAEDCYCSEIVDKGEALQEERTEHDLAGQITKKVSALGYETQYFYDNNGRCTTTMDHYGHCQRRDFDRLGNVVLMVDGTGHETKMEYDEIGRLFYHISILVTNGRPFTPIGKNCLAMTAYFIIFHFCLMSLPINH